MLNKYSIIFIILAVVFWISLFYLANLFRISYEQVAEPIEVNATVHTCDCLAQEQVNVMLIDRLDNCIKETK